MDTFTKKKKENVNTVMTNPMSSTSEKKNELRIVCPFCNAQFTAKMEEDLNTGYSCETCGPEPISGTIDVICENCGKLGRTVKGKWSIQLANRSHKYLRDIKDWIGLCRKCHYWHDVETQRWHLNK